MFIIPNFFICHRLWSTSIWIEIRVHSETNLPPCVETGQWLLSTASHLADDTWLEADSFPGNIRSMAIETPIDAKLILDTALKTNMDLLKRNCRPRGFLKYGYPKTVSIGFNTNSWSKLVEWFGRFGVPQWLRKPPFVHCKDRIIPCTQGQKWFGGWNPGSQHKWAAQFTDKAMVVKGPSLRHRFNDYFSIFC